MAPRGGRRQSRLTGQETAPRGRDPLEIAGESLMEIAYQVKAIRDLGRLRCAFGGTAHIVRYAITRSHFDT